MCDALGLSSPVEHVGDGMSMMFMEICSSSVSMVNNQHPRFIAAGTGVVSVFEVQTCEL